MRYLEKTLPTPAENLALDEALLEEAEAAGSPLETLRFWEPLQTFVVLGRSSKASVEVQQDRCRDEGVPILRRISGGATIVTGPGCLMYAMVLSYEHRPELRAIDNAHRYVLGTLTNALRPLLHSDALRHCGTCDMAVDAMKVSGNSVRCRRTHFLYHGTLLYHFPLEQIQRYLLTPPRMPDYRGGRSHERFVTNLPLPAETIRQAIREACQADDPCDRWPFLATQQLVTAKYRCPEWNDG